MAKKNIIRLTESELKRVITESVKNIISEDNWDMGDWRRATNADDSYEEDLFLQNLTPQDILNGEVDKYIKIQQFWNDIELDYDYLLPALDARMAMLDKKWAWDKISSDTKWDKKFQTDDMWRKHKKDELPKHKGYLGYYQYADTDDIIKAFDGAMGKPFKGDSHIMKAIHNGRNPNTEKLHTKGSANRDLMAIDRQKKRK